MAEAEVTLVTIIDKLSSYNLYVAGANFGLNYLLSHFVKLREREGQGVDPGRSLKGHLWMVDGGYPFPDALH